MGRFKPTWQHTDIPKHIKILLWEIMKDNPTQTAREQAIAKLEFSEKDKWWLRMSRDTFKALEKEIKEMPLEEIDTLPPPLKTYIIGFRPELKSTLDELENEADQTAQNEGLAEAIQKSRHWEDLASLAAQIVTLREEYDTGHPIGGYYGYIVDDPLMIELPKGEIHCLLLHLKAEFPEFQDIDHWKDLLKIDTPEELIQKLALVAHRKTFKGTCPTCPNQT